MDHMQDDLLVAPLFQLSVFHFHSNPPPLRHRRVQHQPLLLIDLLEDSFAMQSCIVFKVGGVVVLSLTSPAS